MAAWVAPDDVPRLAAALGPAAEVIPCDSVSALAAAVRGAAAAAVVGVVCDAPAARAVAALVARNPSAVFAGLAAPPWPTIGSAALLAVPGATSPLECGGLRVTGRPAGDPDWVVVARSLAAARLADPVQRACVAAVLGDVWGAHRTSYRGAFAELGHLRFFAAAFGPGVDTVDDVAARLGVDAGALRARFARHGLPGADRYVAAARLVRAAWAGAPPAPEAVAAAVATAGRPTHSEAPARIHRAVRRLGRLAALGAGACRGWSSPGRAAGTRLLTSYRVALTLPFRDALRTVDPAGGTAP